MFKACTGAAYIVFVNKAMDQCSRHRFTVQSLHACLILTPQTLSTLQSGLASPGITAAELAFSEYALTSKKKKSRLASRKK